MLTAANLNNIIVGPHSLRIVGVGLRHLSLSQYLGKTETQLQLLIGGGQTVSPVEALSILWAERTGKGAFLRSRG